jgi:hypothetical protein
MLRINEGEEIVHALVSNYISGTGYYKFLSKQKADGSFDWVHFKERVNGDKEGVYTGTTATKQELEEVVAIANRNLVRIFGAAAEMRLGKTEVRTTSGLKDDGTIN